MILLPINVMVIYAQLLLNADPNLAKMVNAVLVHRVTNAMSKHVNQVSNVFLEVVS